MVQLCPGPKSAQNIDSFWVRRLFNVCVRVFCAPNATILLVYISAKIKMSFHLKIWFFFAKTTVFCKWIAGPLSEGKTHWMVNWLQLLNQLNFVWLHTKVFMQNSSQWCLRNVQNCWERQWIDVDGASHTFSSTAAIFSLVRTVFGFPRFGITMRMPGNSVKVL